MKYSPMYLILSFMVFLTCFVAKAPDNKVFAETITSPDGRIQVEVVVENSSLQYSCIYNSTKVIDRSLLGWQFEKEITETSIVKTERKSFDTSWTPLWGERVRIPDKYNSMILTLNGKYNAQPIQWQLELRSYNEGIAFRYLLPRQNLITEIKGEKTEFKLPADIVVFPINSTEATYPEDPIPFDQFKMSYAPLTGQFADGRTFSIMEACAIDYPRFQLFKNKRGIVQAKVPSTQWKTSIKNEKKNQSDNSKGHTVESPKDNTLTSAWRLVLLADNERALIENEYLIYNLNPLPLQKTNSESSFNWVKPGLTISNESNCHLKANELHSLIDFAAENNMKYIQLDWGWYGTEWSYNEAEREEWAKNNPDKASDPTWRANTNPTPYKVAHGLVPYFPRFKSSTYVDFNIADLVAYGKSKGVGICLYLNDRMIKKYDIEDLFTVYESWGLSGLKPGFVAYGSAQNSNELRYLAETAAKHKLWLCIHDAYLPDGMSRTFPNVTCVEGGGGQEGHHPVHHDTVLPFTRGLVGPFDYTPSFYVQGRSNAHQMSLLVTLYNPTPVIRGGWVIRNNKSGNAFATEKEFFQYFQSKWQETKVLDAKIGKYIVTARKAFSGNWVLGATGGTAAVKRSIPLTFLDKDQKYKMTLWTDSPQEENGWRSTVKTVKTVAADESVELPLAPAGGAIAVFQKESQYTDSQQAAKSRQSEVGDYWCYFGSYTGPLSAAMKNEGAIQTEGIMVARYDLQTGTFTEPRPVAKINNPSWLTLSVDSRTLYSVGEGSPAQGTANLASYRIDPKSGALTKTGQVGTGGGSPCHLALSPKTFSPLDNKVMRNQYLIASNYGGGDFVFYRLNREGGMESETDRFTKKSIGSLPDGTLRHPRGHAAAFSLRPFNGKYRVYLCDLGNDRVHVGFLDDQSGKFSIDPNLSGLDTAIEAGPRHLVVDSQKDHDIVLVVNENGSTVNAYRVFDKRMESLGAVSTLPPEFKGRVTYRKNLVDGKKYILYNACAEILFDKERRHVYVTNRGHDSVAVYDYHSNGKMTQDILQLKQVISTGGSFPRNIELDPTGRFMIVSNQLASTILVFKRDPKTGKLEKTDNDPLRIGFPLSILFVR